MSKINTECSPNDLQNSVSCFDNDTLTQIVNIYNKKFPNKKIDISNITDKNREKIWNQIKDKFHEQFDCEDEICWIEQSFLKKKKGKLITNFKPEKPEDWYKEPEKWLSTVDIENILSQYMKKFKEFFFVGAVPIDFDSNLPSFGMCVVEALCKINLSALYKKGIRQIGIVFNLDPHYKSGSHWVSMFIDFRTGGIYFFDSYGHKPPQEIMDLMNRIQKMGNEMIINGKLDIDEINNEHILSYKIESNDKKNITLENHTEVSPKLEMLVFMSDTNQIQTKKSYKIEKVINKNNIILDKTPEQKSKFLIQKGFRKFYNNIRFQYKFSECGVYSIHFIVQFLLGYTFKDIASNVIDDNTINTLRDFYFRNIKS